MLYHKWSFLIPVNKKIQIQEMHGNAHINIYMTYQMLPVAAGFSCWHKLNRVHLWCLHLCPDISQFFSFFSTCKHIIFRHAPSVCMCSVFVFFVFIQSVARTKYHSVQRTWKQEQEGIKSTHAETYTNTHTKLAFFHEFSFVFVCSSL